MASGNNQNNRPNLWGMIQNISIASLNKGQFPIAMVTILLLILIIKLPPEDASKLLFDILELLKSMHILGWILSLISLVAWYLNTKHIRKIHVIEVNRIAEEKKELQQQLLGKKLSSSKNKQQL